MKNILVVEDDIMLNSGLCYNLELEGYKAIPAKNFAEGLEKLKTENLSLAILDVNLPDGNGFSLCEKIKAEKNIPVLFLSARDLEEDILSGYDKGADDYIIKPFNINILLKKVKAILKRDNQDKDIYTSHNLTIDFAKLTASLEGKNITFTPTEYKILKIFTNNKDILLTRQLLLEKLYDIDSNFVDEHTLTVNINRLRGKIEREEEKYIKTVYGMGYIWTGASI